MVLDLKSRRRNNISPHQQTSDRKLQQSFWLWVAPKLFSERLRLPLLTQNQINQTNKPSWTAYFTSKLCICATHEKFFNLNVHRCLLGLSIRPDYFISKRSRAEVFCKKIVLSDTCVLRTFPEHLFLQSTSQVLLLYL